VEVTRLAPAGRACSKFIWQNCRLPKTGRSERCRIRAAQPFLSLPVAFEKVAARWPLRLDFHCRGSGATDRIGPFGPAARLGHRLSTTRRSCDAVANRRDPTGFPRSGLATFSPRLGVTARRRNAAGRRTSATANHHLRQSAALARGGLFGLRGPEFVSEFETKQGQ
jgi:hypothetical protein